MVNLQVVTANLKIPFAGGFGRKDNFTLNCSNDELNENQTVTVLF